MFVPRRARKGLSVHPQERQVSLPLTLAGALSQGKCSSDDRRRCTDRGPERETEAVWYA